MPRSCPQRHSRSSWAMSAPCRPPGWTTARSPRSSCAPRSRQSRRRDLHRQPQAPRRLRPGRSRGHQPLPEGFRGKGPDRRPHRGIQQISARGRAAGLHGLYRPDDLVHHDDHQRHQLHSHRLCRRVARRLVDHDRHHHLYLRAGADARDRRSALHRRFPPRHLPRLQCRDADHRLCGRRHRHRHHAAARFCRSMRSSAI